VKKEDMTVYVQFNMNPIVGIDPDAVVLEQPGVMALRRKDVSSEKGEVTVYVDPVALKATQELSKIEFRTAEDGVSNRTGVFHIVIQLNGAAADIESWVKTFDFKSMLGVIDPR
jgi:energy-converting hydrogenase Eha subunit F